MARRVRFSIGTLLLLLSCGRQAGDRPPDRSTRIVAPPRALADETRRSVEARAVKHFLHEHPDLRPASDGDCRDKEGVADMRRLYGIYHPYFVRGDVNDDGHLDFVQAFVGRRSGSDTRWFTVVVFPGKGRGEFGEPVVLEREISLADGDLTIDRDAILITPNLSEDTSRRYRWDPVRRLYEFVSGEEAEPGPEAPPSRT